MFEKKIVFLTLMLHKLKEKLLLLPQKLKPKKPINMIIYTTIL